MDQGARQATHRFDARAGSYSNHPSAGMCRRNNASRAECSWQKSRQPDWLLEDMDPEWAERYQKRFSDFRLPKDATERVALAETIGADGRRLLERVYAESSLPWLGELDAVETLRRVWIQHYHASEKGTRFPRGSRTAALSPAHQFSLRRRSALESEEKHNVDRIQVAFQPRRVRRKNRI